MILGSREPFTYVECARCGCVQIAEIPADLARHYPTAYPPHSISRSGPGPLTSLARRVRSGLLYGRTGHRSLLPIPGARYHAWLGEAGVGIDSAILDVGTGSGRLLHKLRADGFRNLAGVDPYLPEEVAAPGLRMRRCSIAEMQGSFDLVMLHHSLEHIPDQFQTLREAARLVKPSGTVLLRIPVADSLAWRQYGVDWVQLDAPRHLYLHTRRSLALLAGATGMRVAKVLHDSESMQFWGSELYRRDIPLLDPVTSRPPPLPAHFRPGELREFRSRAQALNAAGDGDQACFFLQLG
jgi:SAM-dependent methyltransferase